MKQLAKVREDALFFKFNPELQGVWWIFSRNTRNVFLHTLLIHSYVATASNCEASKKWRHILDRVRVRVPAGLGPANFEGPDCELLRTETRPEKRPHSRPSFWVFKFCMTEMEGYAAPHPRSLPFGISSGAVTATQFHVIHSSGGGYAFSPVLLALVLFKARNNQFAIIQCVN